MIKTNEELVAMAKKAAECKTIYVSGCFGAPMNAWNKARYVKTNPSRESIIKAASSDTFGFDCICFVKGLLWGWCADPNKEYGGAVYCSNGVPDIGENSMISVCKEVSTDFSHIEIGEFLWMNGHCGIYIGDGLCAESTPAWKNGVQITSVNRNKSGYNRRNWAKHGKLPYITYVQKAAPAAASGAGIELPELSSGSKGSSVKAMQYLLAGYGYNLGYYGADGDFGNGTKAALVSFQRSRGIDADGICGPNTWRKLLGVR